MHLFRTFAVLSAVVVISSAAHADFFDVVKKAGQVAEAANTVQAVAEGRVDAPTAALKAAGGGKHGSSHGGKHHK